MQTPIQYIYPVDDDDLQRMLDLQRKNLETNLNSNEVTEQGFVTVLHDLALLKEMNDQGPHIIAKDGSEVVGYALVMTETFRRRLPVLVPMFEQIDQITYGHQPIGAYRYFVMGQICIDKPYRGQGIFDGLYRTMRDRFKDDYDFVVTEIADRNKRSFAAHQRVGFKSVHRYQTSPQGEVWELVVWDWGKYTKS